MTKPHIGTLNEKPLHAALKAWYAQPDDRVEVALGRYVVDIVRGDVLIEIQTGGFTAIRRKLARLAADHPVRLVYPVAQQKWIVRLDENGEPLSRRRSPKRGIAADVFAELVRCPHWLALPHAALEVLLIDVEEERRFDERRGWRRDGWVIDQRRLVSVAGQRRFETPADLLALLPDDLDEPFTTADLAAALGRPRRLAQQMTYCLRELDLITVAGKRQRSTLYRRRE